MPLMLDAVALSGAIMVAVTVRLASVWQHEELILSRGSEPYLNLRGAEHIASQGMVAYGAWHDTVGLQPYGRVGCT